MFTILEKNEESFVLNKSEFIAIVIHVTSLSSVEQHLSEIKKEYPKARHYCYAYIIGDKKKGYDDGEPSKTASRPLLELLEKKELDEVLLVVVRYFGGILLGASRLMGAYLEAGVRVLNSSVLSIISNKYVYKAAMSYKDFDTLRRVMKKEDISFENILYENTISVDILMEESVAKEVSNLFPHIELALYGSRKVYGK